MQRVKQMQLDPELIAMNRVSEVLKYLGHEQRRRIINWTKARFNLIEEPPIVTEAPTGIPVQVETQTMPFTQPTQPTQYAQPVQPIQPVPPTQPTQMTQMTQPMPPLQPAQPPSPTPPMSPTPTVPPSELTMESESTRPGTMYAEKKIFADFDSIENLFLRVNTKKVSHRILLVAAYLQEKGNLDEVSSLDINSHLKKLGYGVSNITTLINGLLKKTPPQIVVTKKEGGTKQSRRKFRVTEKGFKDAKGFINNTNNN